MQANQNFVEIVKNYGSGFHFVVPFDPVSDTLLAMDFTENNRTLTPAVLCDTSLFSHYVSAELAAHGATYGIGGYNEHRTIYQRSAVFDTPDGQEPRRLHVGTDIWGPPDTPLYAPLEATVHSFGFNEAYGDYGTTLILQHEMEGMIFHTLYGHLSLKSIQEVREGQTIEKGEWIGSFGIPAENGQWPPHLHFQVILDMQGWKGDYPGVCRFSEKESYLANCPDPDYLLGLNQYLVG